MKAFWFLMLFSMGCLAGESSQHFDYKNQHDWVFMSGDHQSPVDIVTSQVKPLKDNGKIFFKYEEAVTYDENNGHSIQVGDKGIAVLYGREFSLEQFHFHAPSEHTINGKHYPLEVHFVNRSQVGRIAVISVMFKEGHANTGFQGVLDNLKNTSGNEALRIEVDEMLPKNKSYYHYLGSLTTPPLIENVEWYVMSEPVEVSAEQIKEFNKYYDGNNRNIQNLGDRVILEYNE